MGNLGGFAAFGAGLTGGIAEGLEQREKRRKEEEERLQREEDRKLKRVQMMSYAMDKASDYLDKTGDEEGANKIAKTYTDTLGIGDMGLKLTPKGNLQVSVTGEGMLIVNKANAKAFSDAMQQAESLGETADIMDSARKSGFAYFVPMKQKKEEETWGNPEYMPGNQPGMGGMVQRSSKGKVNVLTNEPKPGEVKPEVQPHSALQRISGIEKAMAEIESTGGIQNEELVKLNPILGAFSGTKLNDEQKARVMGALGQERDYLKQFIPGNDVPATRNQARPSMPAPRSAQASGKKVVRTGTDRNTGRKVVLYEDGTTAYAD